jgi:hypothetical protein
LGRFSAFKVCSAIKRWEAPHKHLKLTRGNFHGLYLAN